MFRCDALAVFWTSDFNCFIYHTYIHIGLCVCACVRARRYITQVYTIQSCGDNMLWTGRVQLKRDGAHGDAREGKWRGNWRMEWVASTLHTTSEHDVSSITTADVHTSAARSRLNWRPHLFKWARPFRRKTKSGFCACAITLQTQSTTYLTGYNLGCPYWYSCHPSGSSCNNSLK
jgi:hypothetical protein